MALWSRARTASSSLFNRVLQHPNNINSSTTTTTTAFLRLFSATGNANNTLRGDMMKQLLHLDINSQIGSCMPLGAMRIGTIIHNIELNPGQGGKMVRAAGTSAKILKEPSPTITVVQLPSGVVKKIDSRCRATIGIVSNPSHKDKKLRKAGQSRWLGRRPTVRGVAMNPVDHPHGGGEGRSKSSGSLGRVSQTPWGKPTKGGYKTGPLKRRK
ncbi:39S RIBOSOMAL PROTEIN L2 MITOCHONDRIAL [Salix viminalis]|uniref:39S RIBOSOMAL PROTEIN L2 MITOCHONDRIAL n=1 Tax=Salix viminalis TaxID=40686 RepID=A0A9Q0SI09_SALVM|nr:39S RIBOSOMAL PROTEIN L2 MITOCHONDRIAL [Salix viminalis]